MQQYDIVIIGAGPAGLAAAVAAHDAGAKRILLLERDREEGGILNQCIHNGFGLHTFKEELTGPEYADRFIRQVKERHIECRLNTMVMEIGTTDAVSGNNASEHSSEETVADSSAMLWKIVTAMSRQDGMYQIAAKAVILAMGCRERSRGALNIPGYRPAGIYSAGTAQRLINMEGYLPGKKVVILGSGDIGLIMARRMTLEGAQVQVVAELMPYSGGLKRNIVQCLDDYGIPLKLSHTVVDIQGKERVEGVTLARVDEQNRPIAGTEETYECDTLLLSVGLLPENELSSGLGVELNPVTSGPFVNESLETNISGVFACGNVLHVHDLVDFVSEEAAAAGRNAAAYAASADGNLIAYAAETGGDLIGDAVGCAAGTSKETLPTAGGTEKEFSGVLPEDSAQTPQIEIEICPENGVRYTVPSHIRLSRMQDEQVIRFRVGNVYKNCYIRAYLNDRQIVSKKRPVMAPGEMEQLKLKKEQLCSLTESGEEPYRLTIRVEEN